MISVIFSVINAVTSTAFSFIWADYLYAIFNNQMSRLARNNIMADITVMLVSLVFFCTSIVLAVKYFRHQRVSLKIPIIIFFIYVVYFFIMFLSRGQLPTASYSETSEVDSVQAANMVVAEDVAISAILPDKKHIIYQKECFESKCRSLKYQPTA